MGATLVAFTFAVLFAPSDGRAEATHNLILRDGAIYTLDAALPWASAVVIADGRIVYVGDDAGSRVYQTQRSRVIALAGKMVLPGFHDAHVHPMSGGMRLLRCRLNDFTTTEQIYAAVRACASAKPGHEWLLGEGWSPQAFAGGGPSRVKLDELSPDRPAYLSTDDGYTTWANSRALALAGIDPNGHGPDIAGLERDPRTHQPTGIVTGDAIDVVRRVIPRPTQAEYREALRRTTAIANRFGVTSMFDANTAEPQLDAYHAADLAGELTVRMVAAQRIDPARGPEQVDELVARRDRVRGRRFRADAAKIFVDEEIDRHTAAMLEAYTDAPGASGDLLIQPDALNAVVRRLDAEGFSIHMHVMGDRAVRAGLDAIERAMRENGARDRRHQLAHIGVADPADIPRFGALGVAANFTALWFPADDPAYAPTEVALGPRRARWMMPMGSVVAAGGRVIASSDWPSPTLNPLDAVQYAVTRQPLDGNLPARVPQERVSLATILAAYTKDAAWGAREEAIDGSIEVGKAADLVVLDRNLFQVDAMALHTVRVVLTLLGGEPVYRDSAFAWPQ